MGELSFEIVEGPDAGRVVPLDGALVIGSDPAVGIPLADPHVEAQHTRVTASGDGALVEDLGDPGGTFVNDAELRVPTRMSAGDELQVGVTVLKLRSGTEAPSEVRPKPPALAVTQAEPAYLASRAARPQRGNPSARAARARSTTCWTPGRSEWRAMPAGDLRDRGLGRPALSRDGQALVYRSRKYSSSAIAVPATIA